MSLYVKVLIAVPPTEATAVEVVVDVEVDVGGIKAASARSPGVIDPAEG